MPTDSLLLSIAVCSVFLFFAAVLAVIDHRTTTWQREKSAKRASEPQSPSAREPLERQRCLVRGVGRPSGGVKWLIASAGAPSCSIAH